MAIHSSTIAWKVPWTEEPGRLQSIGHESQTQLSDFTFTFIYFSQHHLLKRLSFPDCVFFFWNFYWSIVVLHRCVSFYSTTKWIGYVYEKVKLSLSRLWLFTAPWTVARQAPLSMGFSRQEGCSGLPFLSLGDLPDPGIKPGSPEFQAGSLLSEPPGKPHPMMELLKLGVQPLPTTASNQNRPVVWTGLSTLVNRNN